MNRPRERPPRVLIVDDDPAFRLFLAALLEPEGFVLAGQCSRGEDAVRLAQTDPPDAVLLDIVHPGPSGLELLPILRRLLPAAVLAVMSSYPASDMADVALGRGADVYLEKYSIDLTLPARLSSLVGIGE
jgi:DNA-binding response OmpR family regulator